MKWNFQEHYPPLENKLLKTENTQILRNRSSIRMNSGQYVRSVLYTNEIVLYIVPIERYCFKSTHDNSIYSRNPGFLTNRFFLLIICSLYNFFLTILCCREMVKINQFQLYRQCTIHLEIQETPEFRLSIHLRS